MFDFLFGKNSIRARVIASINQKIKNAEEKFLALCTQIDEEAEQKKETAADQLVSEILGR